MNQFLLIAVTTALFSKWLPVRADDIQNGLHLAGNSAHVRFGADSNTRLLRTANGGLATNRDFSVAGATKCASLKASKVTTNSISVSGPLQSESLDIGRVEATSINARTARVTGAVTAGSVGTTGSVVSSGGISGAAFSALNGGPIATSGAGSFGTVTAATTITSNAVNAGTVTASGAVSTASVSATGTVTANGAVTGSTLIASGGGSITTTGQVNAGTLVLGSGQPLTWYQTGSWTPVLSFGGNATGIVYSVQKGEFTRMGDAVHFAMDVRLSSKGTNVGPASLSGFPFPLAGVQGAIVLAWVASSSFPVGQSMAILVPAGTASGIFTTSNSGAGASQLTNTHFTHLSSLVCNGFYFTS